MIAIIDYGRGNLFSIAQALRAIGQEYIITNNPDDIDASDHVLLPGVGAFGDAMNALKENNLIEALHRTKNNGKNILGICLGMQVLASHGEEFGDHEGLGYIAGTVSILKEAEKADKYSTKIPNIGWRKLFFTQDHSIINTSIKNPLVYFVHSYGFRCKNQDNVLATIDVNGEDIPVIVANENVCGFQFHPEKSGELGLSILDNYFKSKT
ncbi:imidazole glycerol phosphate synthase subunit HisH [Terasakiella sp. A23]|uniref:imidazole glycerol phosphate synthase subunit HisH n=1 Tax=Terasakiella sp. FCG-A23 TaxID=3080561 RepID=UPI002954F6D6|nr:imidazole glycerol phosphate synthase subunit HisH [Terasakiella sp. A23]MDV7339793.1 imidazole glycerol phosphate synthase subunit HisH [Terasakiella sp. A23]